ncbi:MAG: glycosyltransferase family A protein [Nonlabens sp.]
MSKIKNVPVCIIVPLYNKEASINDCIQSVLQQDYRDFSLIIVNDGSTDNSLARAKLIEDPRITILNQDNKGVSSARNNGIMAAITNGATHLFLLDADDIWFPNHINTHIKLKNRFPRATVFGSNYVIRKNEKTRTARFSNLKDDMDQYLDRFFEKNFLDPVLHCSSTSFSDTIVNTVGVFDENITHGEDTDFFIKVGISLNIAFSLKVTNIFDQDSENRSDIVKLNKRNLIDLDIYEEKIYKFPGLKKYLDLNRFSLALQFRTHNDIKNAKAYEAKINAENLNLKQRQLLKLKGKQLRSLKKIQEFLGNKGLRLKTGN